MLGLQFWLEPVRVDHTALVGVFDVIFSAKARQHALGYGRAWPRPRSRTVFAWAFQARQQHGRFYLRRRTGEQCNVQATGSAAPTMVIGQTPAFAAHVLRAKQR